MQRIDTQPTHEYQGYRICPGQPFPFGASLVPGGVNFSVFSRNASYCVLVLFEKGAREPLVEIPFRACSRSIHQRTGGANSASATSQHTVRT
jgi:glycogen operon protein